MNIETLKKAKEFFEGYPTGQYDEIAVSGINELIEMHESYEWFRKLSATCNKMEEG